jgi:ribosomal protein S18 acetylase RimI-like enzyme
MFKLINNRIKESNVQELLSYAIFPDPDRLEQTVRKYEGNTSNLQLFGMEEEQELVGLIGISSTDSEQKHLIIEHIAVQPEFRGKGYGRGLILELLEHRKPLTVSAETDEEAVDFYRNIGFSVMSLGEKYPGVERFRCIFEVEEE